MDEETVSDHLEISNAISDALSTPEISGNSHLSTFASFFDDALLNQFMTDGRFDLDRYIESVHIARTVRYENGAEPLLGTLNLPRNRRILLQWIKSSIDPEKLAEEREPLLSAFWLAPQVRLWGRSNRVRSLTDQINRLLRGKRDDDETED